jgi:hypothetical protein
MFCGSCGKELEEGTKFCDSCGAKTEPENAEAVVEEVKTDTGKAAEAPVPEKVVEPVKKEEVKKPAAPASEPIRVRSVNVSKPLGIFAYLWMFILMIIPVVDIIMLCVWAFGKDKNLNKKNFAWASIILILLGVIGWLLIGVIFAEQCKEIYQPIWDKIADFLKL